jgi:DNA invertase Pin-like site-specific DNA recombinase
MKKKPSPIGAAAYARMSANHQSIGDQMKAIREFAKRRGLKIVKAFSDGGNQVEHSKPAKVQKTK